MDIRTANLSDLPKIKKMYQEIVEQMRKNLILIWDDIYPCEFFENDIEEQQLYLMVEKDEIISAFVLCNSNQGENDIDWMDKKGKALYLDRFGVSRNHSRQGMGSLALRKAKYLAATMGAEYLRLFVVDSNIPAIRLYSKNGFIQAGGTYDQVTHTNSILHEYGYEIKL